MLRNFDLAKWLDPKAPLAPLRFGVTALLVANLVAAYLLVRPIGGSPAELREESAELRQQLLGKRGLDQHMKTMAGKVRMGREQGTEFLNTYFLERRAAYRQVLSELVAAAKDAGIQSKQTSFTREPVEGSDALELMKITANYQGTYSDLMHFVNRLDKSRQLLIIEGLQATPQERSAVLNITLKLDAFVRPDGNAVAIAGRQGGQAGGTQ